MLGVEIIHGFGGEDAVEMKAMDMTYGEFYAYNKAAQEWLYFLIDRDVSEGITEDEWDSIYQKAEDFLWEDFKRRMALKRA